jgi:hypothetical protein
MGQVIIDAIFFAWLFILILKVNRLEHDISELMTELSKKLNELLESEKQNGK